MLGVFFMEFSIYLVYFSACHVYWLIFNCDLSNCVVGGFRSRSRISVGLKQILQISASSSVSAWKVQAAGIPTDVVPSRRDIRRTETSPASTVPTSTAGSSATKELLSETTCSCTKKIIARAQVAKTQAS